MSGLSITKLGGPSSFNMTGSGFESVSSAGTQSAQGGSLDVANPLVDNMGSNSGITGALTNVSQLITNLYAGINNGFAAMSNALLGGGGDYNALILRNTRLQAALGHARTFLQFLMSQLDEEKKALGSQKTLGLAAV